MNNLKKPKIIFLLICLLFNLNIFAEGFLSGTLIKISNGYKDISQLKENDLVESYNFKDKSIVQGKIKRIIKKDYKSYIKLTISGKEIITAPDHKFYCPLNQKYKWVRAKDLKEKDFILSSITHCIRIEKIEEKKQDLIFYCLSIDKYQNYFVSEENIFVHNIAWVLGTWGGFEFVIDIGGPLIAGTAFWLSKKIFGGSTAKPDFDDKSFFQSSVRAEDDCNILYKKMTNKQAREEAKKLKERGLGDWEPDPSKKNKDYPHIPVFKNKNKDEWISPDTTGHGGSVWKLLNRRMDRVASLDKDLKILRK